MIKDAINSDPRAKLLDIKLFDKNTNWDINLHWTDEEKESLGIKKKENIMSVDEFNTYVSEIINDIRNYQEAISCLK